MSDARNKALQDTALWKFTYILIYPALLGSMIFEALDHGLKWEDPGKTICLLWIVLLFCLDFWIVHKLDNKDKIFFTILDLGTAIFYRMAFAFVLEAKTGWSAVFLVLAMISLSILMYNAKVSWSKVFRLGMMVLSTLSVGIGVAGAIGGYLKVNFENPNRPFLESWKTFSENFGYGYLQLVLAGLFCFYVISMWRTWNNKV